MAQSGEGYRNVTSEATTRTCPSPRRQPPTRRARRHNQLRCGPPCVTAPLHVPPLCDDPRAPVADTAAPPQLRLTAASRCMRPLPLPPAAAPPPASLAAAAVRGGGSVNAVSELCVTAVSRGRPKSRAFPAVRVHARLLAALTAPTTRGRPPAAPTAMSPQSPYVLDRGATRPHESPLA